MKRSAKAVLAAVAAPLMLGLTARVALAQSLIPPQIQDIFNLLGPGGSGAAGFLTSRIQLALILALGAVVLVAVVYAIVAAIKYISSQGDAGKIEEAQKAIKAIFLGVASMLIAIVGIVLVFVFFGAVRPDPSLHQVCLSAPNSTGCRACYDDADPGGNNSNCFRCDEDYERISRGQRPNQSYPGGNFNSICKEPISR
ncbi:MAG: hypothetical protein ACE5DX_04835 [Candidatus Dojkabacteria bacterium]